MMRAAVVSAMRTGRAAACLGVLAAACSGGDSGIAVTPPAPPAPTLSFIRFATQPGNATAGQAFTVSVELVGSDGARFTTGTNAVVLTVSAGATLSGPTTASAVAGVATFSGISLTKAGSSYQITATSGTLSAISNGFAISAAAVNPANSLFTPSSFTANVTTTITFTFRDRYSNPVPVATVSLATAAAGSTFTPVSGTTGTDGTFITSFRTTSGGTVPITAMVGGVAVVFTATVTSTVGTVNVFFRDAGGALIPSVTYTIAYPGGSTQFSTATGSDVITNVPAGAITITASKAGYNSGTMTGTLAAGGTLTLTVVMAAANSLCAAVPMAFPGSVSGALSASSCQHNSQSAAFYSFTVGGQQGVRFTLTPNGFTPSISVLQIPTPTSFMLTTSSPSTPVQSLWLLPPGTFQVRAASAAGTGSYTLTGTADAGLLTTTATGGVSATAAGSCPVHAKLIVSMTVTGQSLTSTDCLAADNSSYDSYLVYAPNACTITMNSSAFDAYLQVLNLRTGTTVRADDDSGGGTNARITLSACNSDGNIIEIRANSYGAREVGAYSLTLSLSGGATASLTSGNRAGAMIVDRAPAGLAGPAGVAKGVKQP